MGLIRIVHKSIPGGVLLDQRDFNPAIHTRFEPVAPVAGTSAPRPAAAPAPADDALAIPVTEQTDAPAPEDPPKKAGSKKAK